MEAFQLRLWDGRIGRWLSPDPYGQYSSPYLGMGNNPVSRIDPDGGSAIPERDGFANGEIWSDADGKWKWENNMWVGQTSGSGNFLATVRIGGPTISQWNPDFADRWAMSDNFFANASYSIANGAGILAQYMMGRSVNDLSMRNLDGSSMTTNQAVLDFTSFTTLFVGGESSWARASSFEMRGGYGLFGKNGLKIKNHKIEAFYANPSQGAEAGTYFSIKQMKQGGSLLRLDKGLIHKTDQMSIHLTYRFKFLGKQYGSGKTQVILKKL